MLKINYFTHSIFFRVDRAVARFFYLGGQNKNVSGQYLHISKFKILIKFFSNVNFNICTSRVNQQFIKSCIVIYQSIIIKYRVRVYIVMYEISNLKSRVCIVIYEITISKSRVCMGAGSMVHEGAVHPQFFRNSFTTGKHRSISSVLMSRLTIRVNMYVQ